MKILIQNTLFFPQVIGGAEISSHLLGQELRRRGMAVDAVASTGIRGRGRTVTTRPTADGLGTVFEAPAHGFCDPFAAGENSQQPNLLIRGLNHFASVYSPRWQSLFSEILVRTKPDLVHTNTIVGMTPAIWKAARHHGIPVVHTLRDYHLLCPRTTLLRSDGTDCRNPPLPCRILARLKMGQTKYVDAVTGSSRFVLQRHLAGDGFAEAKSFVVPNALEDWPENLPLRRDSGPVRGLFLGQIAGHKGIPLLLEVLAGLFADPACHELHFDFAGHGSLVETVRKFCSTHPDRARYHGHVEGEAKRDLLGGASFMVVPSVWAEPFGRSIIDAFSWGLPVIGSDRGGIPEIITTGRDGLVVNPDATSMSNAIKTFTLDHAMRLQMGLAARARAADFTLDRQVDAFISIYKTLLQERDDHD